MTETIESMPRQDDHQQLAQELVARACADGVPTVRVGNKLVDTVGDDRVTPVLLSEVVTEPWAGAVSMLCPCRANLPVTAELVARLEFGADDTRTRTVVAPSAGRA